MRPHNWLRRNWAWAVGGAFVSVHLFTWLMQKAMKSSVQSERALRSSSQSDAAVGQAPPPEQSTD
ncbi:uncharacterized protein [Eucyclogobius newberryi]|uniref:uncharacterized protein n=1 Tax=Eucyclogobius newberryi TaxID=166745 RepID=UPI003B5B0574